MTSKLRTAIENSVIVATLLCKYPFFLISRVPRSPSKKTINKQMKKKRLADLQTVGNGNEKLPSTRGNSPPKVNAALPFTRVLSLNASNAGWAEPRLEERTLPTIPKPARATPNSEKTVTDWKSISSSTAESLFETL